MKKGLKNTEEKRINRNKTCKSKQKQDSKAQKIAGSLYFDGGMPDGMKVGETMTFCGGELYIIKGDIANCDRLRGMQESVEKFCVMIRDRDELLNKYQDVVTKLALNTLALIDLATK